MQIFWMAEYPYPYLSANVCFQIWMSAVSCQMFAEGTCAVWTRTEATCASRGVCTISRTEGIQSRRSPCTQTRRLDFQTPFPQLLPDLWSPVTPEWGPLRSAFWDTLLRRMTHVKVSQCVQIQQCSHTCTILTKFCSKSTPIITANSCSHWQLNTAAMVYSLTTQSEAMSQDAVCGVFKKEFSPTSLFQFTFSVIVRCFNS